MMCEEVAALSSSLPYFFLAATSFLSANGWYAVGILVLGFIAWIQFGPKVQRWLQKREEKEEAAQNLRGK